MKNAVLVTGATGFLGSALVEEVLSSTSAEVFVLVRASNGHTPEQRLERLWFERPALAAALGTRVQVIEGDIEKDLLGLDPERYRALAKTVGVVLHAAAEVGVNASEQRFWSVNVRGTATMVDFARAAQAHGGLRRIVHVSTAYVAGTFEGMVPERLFGDARYNSLYEKSKHEAELIVSTLEGEVPYAIVRPSQIVGDARTGFITTFNTLYYPLKQYLKGALRVIPAAPDLRINMVPVDYVARLCVRAAFCKELAPACVLHAVGRPEELATLAQLIALVRGWAHVNLRLELPKPRYVPLGNLAGLGRARNLRTGAKRKGPLRNMLALTPYFSEKRTYEVWHAREIMGEPFPDWHEFLPHLLEFATLRGFLNYTDRTVFEQMLMRLRPSASTSFTYYDVDAQGMTSTPGDQARAQIERIAQALVAHGIGRGTRVATLGVNSVRYFTLDAALGLIGAINVPIYYTSSVQDVRELVAMSKARLVVVGTDRMLDALDPAELGAPLVAMSDRRDLGEGIEPWEAFLEKGAPAAKLPYVSLADIATIRYTSGTTGTPKGVTFEQQQVRWMAETMPAVLDWRTRTSGKLRYLSFLPMSHVVEGILVAYAPYYILGDIEMYYLNDFPQLASVLPKVRPNLFFSVPRFYEKVWNQFTATGAGAFWAGLPDGLLKRLLAHPLRYIVLRKVGLDKCRQLIVGSAPISMELLESFRSLGVEIHNAFGVTEAPLITLSPLGANELGSVGHLLPSTEVTTDKEGQVYVRGPQVTRRYDGQDEGTLDDAGWFCTGDLGAWSAQGNLVLRGRKKEILVTAYGKNIAPQKIEMLLKGIDGVSEALVVADARPFVTAVLWLEDELVAQVDKDDAAGTALDFAALDEAVRQVNGRLSHPEQVKRWAVARRPLTVAAAELTPNLKVRRNEVVRTRADVIEGLYDDWDATAANPAATAASPRAGDANPAAGAANLAAGAAASASSDVLHRGEA